METCLFKGKEICAYNIVNSNYALDYKLKKELKIASAKGELICPECGREVVLRAKDPRKKIPHFSHKSLSDNCTYNYNYLSESKDHKKAKMLLYAYFKEKYIDKCQLKINHKFTNGRRSDLYIEFSNDDKLAVEYQRTFLDIDELEKKYKDIRENGTNVLWVLSGDDKTLNQTMQVDASFFEQIMLNEFNKIAIYLDVDSQRLIMAKNMRYKDPYLENNDYEKLYSKSYNLNDVFINTKGIIECDFYVEYEKELTKFSNICSTKCKIEKKKREEINNIQDVHKINEIKYCGTTPSYIRKLRSSLTGDETSLESISKYLMNIGGFDDYNIIRTICIYNFFLGNRNAKDIFVKILSKAGISDTNDFKQEKNMDEIKCPYCNGDLVKKFGKYGAFVSCNNYPKCKFTFSI